MNKFLSEVKGFTPVIDVLVKELGLMPALVYGRVWRFCQMKDKVCTASLETLAKPLGVSRKTVERHIKKLCQMGYLEDRTPDRKYRPHIYADIGEAKIKGLLVATVGKSESPTSELGKTESLTSKSARSDRESYRGQTESPIRKPLKKPSNGDEEREFDSNFPSSDFSTETEDDDDFTSEAIAITIEKLSRKFWDTEHLTANITRAHNLWDQTCMYEEDFVEAMEEAARVTLEAVSKSQVRDRNKKMAYFFAVLEDKLGLREKKWSGQGERGGSGRPRAMT
jgi:DNA-binding MarR family transcriptional regulator